jgi:hypothetical protein
MSGRHEGFRAFAQDRLVAALDGVLKQAEWVILCVVLRLCLSQAAAPRPCTRSAALRHSVDFWPLGFES